MPPSDLPARRNSELLKKIKRKSGKINVGKAKAKIKQEPKPLTKEQIAQTVARTDMPRLLLAIDATASREACWSMAREITEAMFLAVPDELSIGLCYHGGSQVRELTDFTTDKEKFLDKIRTVSCIAGVTRFNDILELACDISRLKVIIYIGDCYEEQQTNAIPLAQHLALKGIRTFIFHDTTEEDGYSLDAARSAFEAIAKAGKGAVFPFDCNSPEVVRSLLEAIAYYSARGLKALKQLDTPAARKLLQAVNE